MLQREQCVKFYLFIQEKRDVKCCNNCKSNKLFKKISEILYAALCCIFSFLIADCLSVKITRDVIEIVEMLYYLVYVVCTKVSWSSTSTNHKNKSWEEKI